MPASFLISPEAKRHERFRRSTRKETLHAIPSLLVKHSSYFRELLSGEFQEAVVSEEERGRIEEASAPNTATYSAPREYDDDEPAGALCVEDWESYFSDSDASYYEDDDDEDGEDSAKALASLNVSRSINRSVRART